MKKITIRSAAIAFTLLFLFPGWNSPVQAQDQPLSDIYCSSYNGCGVYITGVLLTPGLSNLGTVCSTNGYGNYTTTIVPMSIGQNFDVLITVAGSTTNTVCKIFVDWQLNGDFNGLGEVITLNGSPGVGPYTGTITVPSSVVPGLTRLRVRVGNSTVIACSYAVAGETEDYTAEIAQPLQVTAVSGATFCGGDALTVTCAGGSAYTSGNVFTAQISDDQGLFTNPVSIGTLAGATPGAISCTLPASLLAGTLYRVRVVTSAPSTISTLNAGNLTVNQAPALQATAPVSTCSPNTIDLSTTFTDENNVTGTVSYWLDAGCTLPVLNPQAVSSGGTYYVKKVADAGGCTHVIPVTVAVNPTPQAVASSSVSVICANLDVQLTGGATGGTAPYSWAWTGPNGFTSTLQNPLISNAQTINSGSYSLTVTDANGCFSTNSSFVNIIIIPRPVALAACVAPNLCANGTVNLVGSASGSSGPYVYVWTGPNAFVSTLVSPTITNAQPTSSGIYSLVVTDQNGCSSTNNASVTVNVYPLPAVDAGNDVSIYLGSSTNLQAIASGGTSPYQYNWTPVEGLDNSTLPNPLASPAVTTIYTVNVTDANTCSASDQVTVTVELGYGNLEGQLTYDNNAHTPLNNVLLTLKSGNTTIATTTTDVGGHYSFAGVMLGTYNIYASCTKPWGGANAVDALLIMKHFTGLSLLSGIRLTAADVDNSSYINANDALTDMKRFVGMITTFLPGDWAIEHPQVVITLNNTTTRNFKGVCTGDVDGSFIPAP
ncbi:MAG: GEVED domain-containing protein [Bacteroidetes bacterium]|nr:GEVED domain-containing protein [Bacteroidota bacterium]